MAIRDLIEREFQAFDKLAGETVQMWQSEILTDLMLVITQLGSTLIYVCVLVLVVGFLLLTSRFWEALILFISLLGSWLLNNLMKEMFARPRPALQHLVEATGYSFPSGHASISTAFYGMIGYLIWVSLKGQYRRAWHVPVLTCLVLVAIGISRVYLGVHYASDILAGYLAGGFWLGFCIWLYHLRKPYLRHKPYYPPTYYQ